MYKIYADACVVCCVGLKEVNIQQIGLDEKIAIEYEMFTEQ